MQVLVLGASGGVGRHAVELAVKAGHEVTALARGKHPFNAWISCADVADWMASRLAPGAAPERTPIISEVRS